MQAASSYERRTVAEASDRATAAGRDIARGNHLVPGMNLVVVGSRPGRRLTAQNGRFSLCTDDRLNAHATTPRRWE